MQTAPAQIYLSLEVKDQIQFPSCCFSIIRIILHWALRSKGNPSEHWKDSAQMSPRWGKAKSGELISPGGFSCRNITTFSFHIFTWEKTNDNSSRAVILQKSECKFWCYGAPWSNAYRCTAPTAHRAQTPPALQHAHLWMRALRRFLPSGEPLSRQHIRHHFSCRYPSSSAPLTYEPAKPNTWLSRIIASGCSAAPGGPTSGTCLRAEVSCLLYAAGRPRWHVGRAARCRGNSLLLGCAWHLPREAGAPPRPSVSGTLLIGHCWNSTWNAFPAWSALGMRRFKNCANSNPVYYSPSYEFLESFPLVMIYIGTFQREALIFMLHLCRCL